MREEERSIEARAERANATKEVVVVFSIHLYMCIRCWYYSLYYHIEANSCCWGLT